MKLSAVILEEGSHIVIQGLESDIAAQGATLNKAVEAFKRTVEGQIALDRRDGLEPLIRTPPAPEMYHRMFRNGDPAMVVQVGVQKVPTLLRKEQPHE